MEQEVDYKKLYEEARERAKAWHRRELAGTQKEMAEYIFPDLKESEDERIRKMLIRYFKELKVDSFINLEIPSILAWLEKQKEQNVKKFPFLLGDAVPYDEGYNKGYEDALKEQKPINESNMHEPTLDEARKWNEAYEKGYSLGYENGRNEQKPAEWSYPYGKNETVDQLIAIAECLEMDGDCLFNGYKGKDCGKFLRELARRESENKHAEWSDEDKKALDILSAVISYNLQNIPTSNKIDRDNLFTLKRWKDGLRPQWKPTEDQLQLLKNAEHILYVDGKHVYSNAVHEAYEYLKKL